MTTIRTIRTMTTLTSNQRALSFVAYGDYRRADLINNGSNQHKPITLANHYPQNQSTRKAKQCKNYKIQKHDSKPHTQI